MGTNDVIERPYYRPFYAYAYALPKLSRTGNSRNPKCYRHYLMKLSKPTIQ